MPKAARGRSALINSLYGIGGLVLALLLAATPASPFYLVGRGLYLCTVLTPMFVIAPAAAISPTVHVNILLPLMRRSLGCSAALVKWGQWAATRPDLVPASLCDVLSALHAHAPVHTAGVSRGEIEAAIGTSIESYFESFSDTPLASGSIGQIHVARLNGTQVAVKVRHPRVSAELEADFQLLELVAAIIDRLPGLGWLDAQSTIRQFGWALQRQASLEDEAHWLRAVGHNFRSWTDVIIPQPILATPSVLIETLVPGLPIGEYISFAARTRSAHDHVEGRKQLSAAQRHYIVQRGVDIYYKMLLSDNLMHADLHPGNLLFDEKGREGLGAIGMVDLGMTAVLTPEEQHNFIGFLVAVGEGDGRSAARCVLRWAGERGAYSRGKTPQDLPPRGHAFIEAMACSFGVHCLGYGHGIDLGVVLRETLGLIRDHRIPVGANYVTLVVNAMCLEGMARQLVPEYNVMDAARPLLVAHAKLPRHVFSLINPAARLAKRIHDRKTLRLLRGWREVEGI